MKLLQIVPQVPPNVSGVGDYSVLLANELLRLHGVETHFLLASPSLSGLQSINGFQVTTLQKKDSKFLANLLIEWSDSKNPVLLQFVGYGYEKRGCPIWLSEGICRWQNLASDGKLITYFHEIYANGPPWRSSFWLSPIQRWIVNNLANHSAVCMTNTREYGLYLSKQLPRPSPEVVSLPVFSNIGESYNIGQKRNLEIVIFGGTSWREPAYTTYKRELEVICSLLNIQRIHDIGAPLMVRPCLGVEVLEHGILAPESISALMQSSYAGIVCYPFPYLGKSGTFAAYAANALVPITIHNNVLPNKDGLILGKHVLTLSSLKSLNFDIEKNRHEILNWYSMHNLSTHASFIFSAAVACHSTTLLERDEGK